MQFHQAPVHIGVNGLGHFKQPAGVLRHLIEQPEVGVKDAPYIQQAQRYDGGLKTG